MGGHYGKRHEVRWGTSPLLETPATFPLQGATDCAWLSLPVTLGWSLTHFCIPSPTIPQPHNASFSVPRKMKKA